MNRRHSQFELAASVMLALLLLGSLAAYRVKFQAPSRQADAYHDQVRSAAAQMPLQIGTWIGHDVPMTPGAIALLHPNVAISRQYVDLQTNRSVNFLLVQCQDARDILGHYPPVCYVMHGWTSLSAVPRTWQVGNGTVRGMEYEYSKMHVEEIGHIAVCDFMLLPDGRTCGDMETVERAARDYRTRFFGAAQVQLQTDVTIPAAERDQIFQLVLEAARPTIERIRSEVRS